MGEVGGMWDGWVECGMGGWARQDGDGWSQRGNTVMLINHVSILVGSKLCVCMAELG